MWGAIIGDIIGSRFENANLYSEYFETFDEECVFTDDTLMTIATIRVLQSKNYKDITDKDIELEYRSIGLAYKNRGFGGLFLQWILSYNQKAYGSFGNGALMRISPVAKWAYDNNISKNEALELAEKFTIITHNHSQAVEAVKIYISILYDFYHQRNTEDIENNQEIMLSVIANNLKGTIYDNLPPLRDFKMKNLESSNLSCEYTLKTVLSALKEIIDLKEVFNQKFEVGLKKIIAVGGDTDTNAAILGPLLEILYGIPANFKYSAYKLCFKEQDEYLIDSLNTFYDEDIRTDSMFMKPNLLSDED